MIKKYSAKVVMGAVALGVTAMVGSAVAAVNLNDGTFAKKYATEINGTVAFGDTIVTKVLSTFALVPPGVPATKLSCDGVFLTAPLPVFADVAIPVAPAATLAATAYAGGVGAAYQSSTHVVAGNTIALDDTLTWNPTMTVLNGATPTCTYSLYETVNFLDAGNPKLTKTGQILGWEGGFIVGPADQTCLSSTGCNSGNYAKIDLETGSKKFINNKTKGAVASLQVNARFTDGILDATGAAPVSYGGMVDSTNAGTNITVTGDFKAASKVWLEAGATSCSTYAVNAAGTLSADKTSVTFDKTKLTAGLGLSAAASGSTAANGTQVCVEVDGSTPITPSTYSAVVNLKATAGYNLPLTTTLPLVGKVVDNGSFDALKLVLTPGGAYPGFIRISHVGLFAGDISLALITDAGTTVTVKLEDIAGQTTSSLGAGNSTSQLQLSDIYAAAQAQDPTFNVAGGKLRIIVKSTAPSANGNAGDTVNASVYSTSKDGNSFVLIQE